MLFSDPFRDLDSLTADLLGQRRANRSIPMDAWRDEEALHLSFEVPGVARENISLEMDRGTLTIGVDKPIEEVTGQRIVNERQYGRVIRRVTLGEGLDVERIEAKTHDGVLSLVIPLAERLKPRKIEIASADQGEMKEIST